MQVVPLQPVASQTLLIQLGGQACTIAVFQTAYGLFATVSIGTAVVVASVLCQNLKLIVRSLYLGFVGDLAFFDTAGADDPVFTGLGSRFQLLYLSPAELPVGTTANPSGR